MDIDEYERYGRQMIVPEMGLSGQLVLKNSKILVVGAGGLGCPALAYLAGAGIGTIGIIDPDTVEMSNLHRQILHHKVGQPKAESAAEFISKINPKVECRVWVESLTNGNALGIVREFDLVLDCTDTPMTRYLINDACVLADKPLVSASALKTEGQLAVYHFGSKGPCYRCVFPKPPPPQLVGTCGDNGILGPVVGVMGVSQAVEALKVLLSYAKVIVKGEETPMPFLSLYSMFSFPQWRQMRIRYRQPGCDVCGDNPTIKNLSEVDYPQFCGSVSSVSTTYRLNSEAFAEKDGIVLDVRPSEQFSIVSLPESVSLPITQLRKLTKDELQQKISNAASGKGNIIKVVCHNGNDSQEAVEILRQWGMDAYDLIGGLSKWSKYDEAFPVY